MKSFNNKVYKILDGITKDTTELGKNIKDTATTPINDHQFIKETNRKIEQIVKDSRELLDKEEKVINLKFEEFDRFKLQIIGITIKEFTDNFSQINNFPYDDKETTTDHNTSIILTRKSFKDLREVTNTISNMLKDGTIGMASGVLGASAVVSTVSVLGTASTGTAIATLSGIASTNATLAWLGGGSLAVGGGGMAMGTLMLGGITIVPVVAFFMLNGTFDLSEKRDQVEQDYKEAKAYAKSVDKIIEKFKILDQILYDATVVINKYNKRCDKYNWLTERLISKADTDYNNYSLIKKKLINQCSNEIEGLVKLLNVTILDENNSVNLKDIKTYQSASSYFENIPEIDLSAFCK